MAVKDYKTNPDENTTISGINIAEGCPPSGINNAIRQLMADVKVEYDNQAETNKSLEESASALMEGATADAAGKSGNVPVPDAGKQDKPLNGAGQWADFLDCVVTALKASDGSAVGASDIVKKSGSEILGALRFFMNDAFIAALDGADDLYGKRFIIDTYEDGKTGAAIDLMKGDSSQRPGEFAIHARNALATVVASLRGAPDGKLTWKDKLLIPVEVWQEPGGHGFYRVFDDGFCVQGSMYGLDKPQSAFDVVVPLFRPLRSFEHFPLIVSTDVKRPQTNISIANRTTTSFNAIGSPNYGCSYTQQYFLWVDFGFIF